MNAAPGGALREFAVDHEHAGRRRAWARPREQWSRLGCSVMRFVRVGRTKKRHVGTNADTARKNACATSGRDLWWSGGGFPLAIGL